MNCDLRLNNMDHPGVASLIRYPPSNNSLLSSGNTKRAMTYEPRTEAISPAINDDFITNEDSTSDATRDEQTLIVEKLRKVEAEILQTDLQISRLRKQKALLERATAVSLVPKTDEEQENVCDTKQLSIAKLVYHENRVKAQRAHAKLDCVGGITRDLPVYNQPSDNEVYHYNASKFASSFKSSLIASFKQRLKSRVKVEESVSTEYDRRMEKWLRSIEQEDSQPAKRIKDAKMREFFEKIFPELKRARESGERFSRVGQRVARSDAELDEILDGINEREDQDKKVKSYAVIPPMLEEMRAKKPRFINVNGYVEDIEAEYKEYLSLKTWTDEEKDIFRENYLQHPKNFGLIATMASRKSVADCVQYYYSSKKSENYKQLLKRQQKRRTRSFVRPAQQTPAIPIDEEAIKTNGVSSNEKQGSDSTSSNTARSIDQSKNQLVNSMESSYHDKMDVDVNGIPKQIGLGGETPTCCICSCDFSDTNQSRNVTRSNHQLYGIATEALKPGLRICYSCRFRHVKHPNYDEPSSSDLLEYSEEVVPMHTNTSVIQQVDVKPVIECNSAPDTKKSNIPNCKQINKEDCLPVNSEPVRKQEQSRTCVRDIIYQAIEMSFQKPASRESTGMTGQAQHGLIDASSNLPPSAPSIQNMPPVRPIVPNHSIPMSTSHVPSDNLGLDQHHFQAKLQQKQMQMDFNARQQTLLQMHRQQLVQHQQLPSHRSPMTHPPILNQNQNQLPSHHCMIPSANPPYPIIPNQKSSLILTRLPAPSGPMNLCRKYDRATEEITPSAQPPVAHGVKNSSISDPMTEAGVLNLSRPSASRASPPNPAQSPAFAPRAVSTFHPSITSTMMSPNPINSNPQSLSTAPSGAISSLSAPLVKKAEEPEQFVDSGGKQSYPKTNSPPQDIPRSPGLTGSPASPSQMVIDESADAGSPSSSDNEEAKSFFVTD